MKHGESRIQAPAKGNLAGLACEASAEGSNGGWMCCNCGGVGRAAILKGVEAAVAVEEVFERRESE